MKLYTFFYFGFCFLIISCTKNGSSSTKSNSGLLKNITFITHPSGFIGPAIEKYYFTYDEQNRLSFFIDSGVITNTYAKYNFLYSGNQKIPDSYTLIYDITGLYTEVHALTSNAQNQILSDSVVSSNNQSGSGNSYYSYSSGLVTRIASYYRSELNFTLVLRIDSFYLDANNNVFQMTIGINPNLLVGVNGYQSYLTAKYSYGNISSPFYNTPASLISFLRGGVVSKNCPVTLEEFIDSSGVINRYQYSFKNDAGPEVLLQNVINTSTGDTTLYTYY